MPNFLHEGDIEILSKNVKMSSGLNGLKVLCKQNFTNYFFVRVGSRFARSSDKIWTFRIVCTYARWYGKNLFCGFELLFLELDFFVGKRIMGLIFCNIKTTHSYYASFFHYSIHCFIQ